MNQAFFTLSLGIGSMAIFGSYIGKDRALMGESVNVSLLDTFVAFTSGLIIFPACYAYGVAPDAGPGLIFVTLPNFFNNLPGGRLWGALFFVFMSFAAISTVIAVFENILSCTMDIFNWSRKKAAIVDCIAILILMVPCILGFSVWSNIALPKIGNIMDMEDFLVSMQQVKKMGSMSSLLGMLPGVGSKLKDVDIDDKALTRVEAMIYSMTPEERRKPQLLNASRKRRIVKGSGTSIQELNRLLKQFEQSKTMMKQLNGMKGKRRGLFGGKNPFGF